MIVNINPLLIEIDFLIIIYYEKILCRRTNGWDL